MLGLETALALAITELDLAVDRRSSRCCRGSRPPSPALGERTADPIVEGRAANLCVIDPAATWTVDPARLASRSRNTPYAGRTLTGRVRHTFLWGEPVVVDGEATR